MKEVYDIINGILVVPQQRRMFGAQISIYKGKIVDIKEDDTVIGPYILPGFVDSHVHIESSMLIPSRFAQMAVQHGTVAVVTDPHEVANVAGESGIRFMIDDARSVPMKFFFGLPSCVPASPMEKSGSVITSEDVGRMIVEDDFYFLAEMMNFPGVIYGDNDVIGKLESTKKAGKPIDGHAPGLEGNNLVKYVNAGISTDHECSTIQEAIKKIELGQKIQIREGSAAKNFENLAPLIKDHSPSIMFCTDDCHPDYLAMGHINKIVARAISKGYDLYDVLKIACTNPVEHYSLPVGQLRVGDDADFIITEDLQNFNITNTYIKGEKVFEKGSVMFKFNSVSQPEYAFRKSFPVEGLEIIAQRNRVNVIQAIDGELITKWSTEDIWVQPNSALPSNIEKDLLKIVLLDRYSDTPPAIAFIRGFGIKQGALAASIAHDSHHLIAIGCDDRSIQTALEWLIENKGGMCFANRDEINGLRLPFFGLMTDSLGAEVKDEYTRLNKQVKNAGCTLHSPFMTASFMALTVIPELKINHNGLFDVNKFKSIPLFQ
ncbi:MAG: adenine deaminase [Tenuifilaceae bacterium]|jgi:adenine deaminase|nr:adenine deaminase [Tenuifilaceae bacterium]